MRHEDDPLVPAVGCAVVLVWGVAILLSLAIPATVIWAIIKLVGWVVSQ